MISQEEEKGLHENRSFIKLDKSLFMFQMAFLWREICSWQKKADYVFTLLTEFILHSVLCPTDWLLHEPQSKWKENL